MIVLLLETQEELNQLKATNEKILSIIAERTGKTKKEIAKVTKYDSYFDAESAIKFGLASAVVSSDTLKARLNSLTDTRPSLRSRSSTRSLRSCASMPTPPITHSYPYSTISARKKP